jgi:hypothetical protein
MSWATDYRTFSAGDPLQLERERRHQYALELRALQQHHADPLKRIPPGHCKICGGRRFDDSGRILCNC